LAIYTSEIRREATDAEIQLMLRHNPSSNCLSKVFIARSEGTTAEMLEFPQPLRWMDVRDFIADCEKLRLNEDS